MGKLKVFEAAKQLNLSSEALIALLKELNFPPRGYTSYITEEEFNAARQHLRREKHQFKESIRRRREITTPKAPPAQLEEPKDGLKVKQPAPKVYSRERKKRRLGQEETQESQEATAQMVKVTPYMTVAELAQVFNLPVSEIIKKCLSLGLRATVNHRLDIDTIMLLADEFKIAVKEEEEVEIPVVRGEPLPRPPVVVVMGHVDHGKTALLDYIRKTNVVEQEVGRITQHIGAYVAYYNNKPIVFLDTPGHEAFASMRARGAQVTDIAVLVVAADEGVMPQTLEALDHARAAGVPIIVAITKSDLSTANPARVKSQLASHNVRVEDYGGHTVCVETSAVTGQGIEALLDAILVLSLEMDLKASYDGPAQGVVIEARLDRGRGNIATVLIQEGTLKRGDSFVAGEHYGRVRDMLNEMFLPVEVATPSIPVQVVGFSGLPQAGERFEVVGDERTAREIAHRRLLAKRDRILAASKPKVTLEALQEQIAKGQVRELKIVLKTDVAGSAEVLREALEGLSLDEVKVRVIHSGVGPITRNDVLLAQASQAIIVGFHVRPLAEARQIAEQEGVEIRTYKVIYAAIGDVRAAMLGMLEPEKREVFLGHAEVRQVFSIPGQGLIAGSFVTEGKVVRGALVRIIRDNKEVFASEVISLRRYKEDVKEVATGYECGIGIKDLKDLQIGDILEFYSIEETPREIKARKTEDGARKTETF
ncbi:MAG: translation initiation factor IF-2 [candidate division WOR-3 bacterium]